MQRGWDFNNQITGYSACFKEGSDLLFSFCGCYSAPERQAVADRGGRCGLTRAVAGRGRVSRGGWTHRKNSRAGMELGVLCGLWVGRRAGTVPLASSPAHLLISPIVAIRFTWHGDQRESTAIVSYQLDLLI
ncbi:MAG: hypothetical protein HRT61_02365 [Ekhidna sp.]|nr:hypothetical protein [Ekhidna sp.]